MIYKILAVIYLTSVFTLISTAAIDCSLKPNITNANVEELNPELLEVTCLEGYKGTKDNETLTCLDGTWTKSEINCVAALDCSLKPNITNANVEELNPELLEVTCLEGYKGTKDNETLTCPDGTWTKSEINCLAALDCSLKPNITNANVEELNPELLEVTCLEGYKGTKDSETLTCPDGTWTKSEINCVAIGPCGEEPNIANAKLTQGKSDTLLVSCLKGYIGTKENETIICQNGTWTQSIMNCTDSCTILPNITNAMAEFRKPGLVKVTCLKGYTSLADEVEISCSDGTWEESDMNCAEIRTKLNSTQAVKFSEYFVNIILNKRYFVCVFLDKRQNCGCFLGKMVFKHWKGKKVVGHNKETIENLTLEECQVACLKENWCVSFEHKNQQICHLSETAHYMISPLLFVDADSVTYHEKYCKYDDM